MTNQSLSLSFVNIGLLPPKKNPTLRIIRPCKGWNWNLKMTKSGCFKLLKMTKPGLWGFFFGSLGEKSIFNPSMSGFQTSPRRGGNRIPLGPTPPVLSTKLSNELVKVVCYCSFVRSFGCAAGDFREKNSLKFVERHRKGRVPCIFTHVVEKVERNILVFKGPKGFVLEWLFWKIRKEIAAFKKQQKNVFECNAWSIVKSKLIECFVLNTIFMVRLLLLWFPPTNMRDWLASFFATWIPLDLRNEHVL